MEEKIAEFVGIMLGDGNIGIYNTKAGNRIKIHRRVKVSLDSRNLGYINHVVGIMKEVLNTEPRFYWKKKENAVDISTHKKEVLDYVLNIIGLKISPKWNRMEVPAKYNKGGLAPYVVKGLFDTDGHLSVFNNNGTIYPRIEIPLCPCPAQGQVIDILKDLGFNCRIQSLERGKIRIRISGMKQLGRWVKLIGSSNPIHADKIRKMLA